jgi:hypothetical protein
MKTNGAAPEGRTAKLRTPVPALAITAQDMRAPDARLREMPKVA